MNSNIPFETVLQLLAMAYVASMMLVLLRRMAEINGEPILDNLQAHNGSVGLWVRRLFAPRCLASNVCLAVIETIEEAGD